MNGFHRTTDVSSLNYLTPIPSWAFKGRTAPLFISCQLIKVLALVAEEVVSHIWWRTYFAFSAVPFIACVPPSHPMAMFALANLLKAAAELLCLWTSPPLLPPGSV